jgi:hypothetical protein
MKKNILAAFSVIIVVMTSTTSVAQEASSFSANAVFNGSISGIDIPSSSLIRKVGNPLRKATPEENKCLGYTSSTWVYKNFTADVSVEPKGSSKQSIITSLSIKSGLFKTKKGVKVGDLLSKVVKLYGAEIEIDDKGNKFINITNASDGSVLSFNAGKNGKIKSINVSRNC